MSNAKLAEQTLARATALHRSGNLAEAIALYQEATRLAPRDANALNLHGLASFQFGRAEQGAALVAKALAINPNLPGGFYNLAMMSQALGRHDDARHNYEKALAQNHGDVQARNNLGTVLRALNEREPAIEHYRKALALEPNFPEARYNLANVLQDTGRHEEAIAEFQKAVALKPDFAAAYTNCGHSLQALGRHAEAVTLYERVIALQPRSDEGYFNLGNALWELGQHEDAIGHFERAFAIRPDARTLFNIANALRTIGRDAEALAKFDQAIAMEPGNDEFANNKGLLLLSLGRFAEGWDLVERRWSARAEPRRPYPQPLWNGEFVDGRLLVWPEQGLGDQILYASLIEDLRPRARALVVEAPPQLKSLFSRSFPDVDVVEYGEKLYGGEIAAHSPIGNLAKYLRPDWNAFSRRDQGFLVADPAKTRALRERLDDGRLVIGLSWHSYNPKTNIEKGKSAPLVDFKPLFALPGCRFVDLQYGDTKADRTKVARDLDAQVEHLDDIDNTHDIDALAALISACDIVVTISNATAHLAGALGKRTYVLVPYGITGMWHWFKDRTDSPWYPQIMLRRRKRGQSWAELIAALADEISRTLPQKVPANL